MKLIYKKNKKYKLPLPNVDFKKPSDIDTIKTDEYIYVLVEIIKKTPKSIYVYDTQAYPIQLSGLSVEKVVSNVSNTFSGNFRLESYTKMDNIRNGIVVILVRTISFEMYRSKYAIIRPVCANCLKEGFIIGNELFQKTTGQIPGTKRVYWACNQTCKSEYRKLMQLQNNAASKETRKRFHKAIYTDTYGFVYGVCDELLNKWYIGKATQSPFARWEDELQKTKALHEIPIERLSFRVLHVVKATGSNDEDQEVLHNLEKECVIRYDSINNGYNIQMPKKYISKQQIEVEQLSPDEIFENIFGQSANEYVASNLKDIVEEVELQELEEADE